MTDKLILDDLLLVCERSLDPVHNTIDAIRDHLDTHFRDADGVIDADKLERDQYAAHGLSWFATYGDALQAMLEWAQRLDAAGKLGELEQLLLQASFSEYLHQIFGGLPMSQSEIVRLSDFEIEAPERHLLQSPDTTLLREHGFSRACKQRIADLNAYMYGP